MMGDHHHWRKTYAYEGSARVPFVVRYPQSWDLPRSTTLTGPVELRDIMPTMLEAAGVEIPDSVDGDSLLRLWRGEGWRGLKRRKERKENISYDSSVGLRVRRGR